MTTSLVFIGRRIGLMNGPNCALPSCFAKTPSKFSGILATIEAQPAWPRHRYFSAVGSGSRTDRTLPSRFAKKPSKFSGINPQSMPPLNCF